jgi:MbtH protein
VDDEQDDTAYRAVVNHEEQHSIWPADRDLPAGWTDTGHSGTKRQCLDYIEEVWTDLRPLSLRRQMDQADGQPGITQSGITQPGPAAESAPGPAPPGRP